jgi:hypothetical protein
MSANRPDLSTSNHPPFRTHKTNKKQVLAVENQDAIRQKRSFTTEDSHFAALHQSDKGPGYTTQADSYMGPRSCHAAVMAACTTPPHTGGLQARFNQEAADPLSTGDFPLPYERPTNVPRLDHQNSSACMKRAN